MATFEIDESSKQAKALIAMLKTLDFVKLVKKEDKEVHYNPEFVRKVKEAEKSIKEGDTILIDPNDIWGSLGLK